MMGLLKRHATSLYGQPVRTHTRRDDAIHGEFNFTPATGTVT
jgi:hypothetical protein